LACETCRLLKELLESAGVSSDIAEPISRLAEPAEKKAKRKASDYSKRYGRNFKRIAGKYKLKSGAWAKNGFKRAQKEAHRLSKKKK
jgi:RNase P subunit RPR2